MIDEPATQGDEYCALLLAACDEALVAGEPSSILKSAEVPPELRRRLERAMASVRLLRQSFHRKESAASASAPLPWTTLGRFQIRRELGRGAYGIVYLAYDPQLRREVALKVPRPESIVTPELRDRFLREAQAAASLEHPNLVPVYEVGEVGPVCYLASAYCRGQTLAAWLKEQPELAPWRQAAELVATLADGVEHAHGRGILHRDLKPANILLTQVQSPKSDVQGQPEKPWTLDFGHWTPRITDFGLAKFLLDGEQEPTRSGTVLGTAAYMAPEQASGHSRQVGRHADIYALGVILYELLTGRPPFQSDSMLETLEQVRTQEPVSPRRLRPRLPRDLETVCLKCLQKEPGERYQSAGELGEELRRFLRGEPIRARPVSAVNRAVRWCRRNAALATASGTAALGVLCALGLSIGWAFQQSRAAVRLREEVARAEQSAEESQAVFDFFRKKVLSAAGPKGRSGGLGRQATIREAVEAAEPAIAQAFAGQPLVEAAIRDTLGVTYGHLGEPKHAIDQLERAVDQRRSLLGSDHPLTLGSMNNLAFAYHEAGRVAESISLHVETLKLQEAALGRDHPDTFKSMSNLASAYRSAGRLADAISLHVETLDLEKAKLGPDDLQTLSTMNRLANGYLDAGRRAEAVSLLEEATKLYKAKLGLDHPDTLDSMNELAKAYRSIGRVSEALALFQQALDLQKAGQGPDHPATLFTMNNMAIAYRDAGHLSKALLLFEETHKIRKTKFGPDHPDTLNSAGNLALAYREAGRLAEAVPLLEETLKVRKAKLGPNHPETLRSMNNMANGYRDCGRLSEAIPLSEETLLSSASPSWDRSTLQRSTP